MTVSDKLAMCDLHKVVESEYTKNQSEAMHFYADFPKHNYAKNIYDCYVLIYIFALIVINGFITDYQSKNCQLVRIVMFAYSSLA